VDEWTDQRVAPFEGDTGGAPAQLVVGAGMEKLQIEQLIECEAPATHLGLGERFRTVQEPKRDVEGRKSEGLEQLRVE
jgi:hypothetical protein